MKRILLRFSIALLTFSIGVYVTNFVKARFSHHGPVVINELTLAFSSPPLKTKTVVAGGIVCEADDSTKFLKFSDGSFVSLGCRSFPSAAAAHDELHKRSFGATGLIESAKIEDSDGKQVGETVVFTSPTVFRLATKDNLICETQVSSVQHLRWFEQQAHTLKMLQN